MFARSALKWLAPLNGIISVRTKLAFQGGDKCQRRQEDVFLKVIVYQSSLSEPGGCLTEVVKSVVSETRTEIYTTMPELAFRLRGARHDIALAILSAATQPELSDLAALGNLLLGLRLILILPDGQPGTVARALTLYPRYMSYGAGDFTDVVAVLEKMLKPVGLG